MPPEIDPASPAPLPLRVLLVEDNPDDAALLERHLRRNGFMPQVTRVETAETMSAALETGGQPGQVGQPDRPDVIIADYNLPAFSGPAALQLLRASGLDIPFIMMSGAITEETAVESMRAGAQDYVTKQNLARLIPVLQRELREASARRNRLAAELALHASQVRFERLVSGMPLGLLIGGAGGRILYVNGAAERLLGYPEGTLITGQVALANICPALSATYMLNEVAIAPFESVCSTASGQTIEVLIGVARLNPEAPEEEREIAAFIADLSLQKKSEEVLRRTEKLAVAGRLAASIAHEINNPLEAITNCLYLVSRAELPAEARTYLALAQDELDRVAQITVQTLRFYRRSTNTGETNVHELLETVLALLSSRMKRQNIAVVRDFRPIPKLEAHDGEIRQVLANLVGNAIDAMPGGGIMTLRTSAGHGASGAEGLRVTIADTGTGMSPATAARIFEPFFSTKGITGTGLGLWVSREIVDKHGGTLRARTRERTDGQPGGTVFSLFLPLAHIAGLVPER